MVCDGQLYNVVVSYIMGWSVMVWGWSVIVCGGQLYNGVVSYVVGVVSIGVGWSVVIKDDLVSDVVGCKGMVRTGLASAIN